MDVGVDYFALSFVRSADVIYELKDYLRQQGATGTASIGVLAKIESADSVENLESILVGVAGWRLGRAGRKGLLGLAGWRVA